MKKEYKIHAVVAPVKKRVKILQGKTVLKEYSFKRDIPFKMVEKECHGYDFGAWSVSEREFTYMQTVKEWDKEVIKEIETMALEEYFKSQPPKAQYP